jgi:enterobactin synthetase component D
MATMSDDFIPACCTPPSDHWPLPMVLPGLHLISTRFDPGQLNSEDFQRCAITPVVGVAKRQAEYLAGRLCARQALHCLTGHAQVPAIGSDRAPLWPPGVSGSITHGAGWAGAMVGFNSQWRGLGLDVEKLIPAARAERLASEILTPAELLQLDSLPSEHRVRRITLTFSAKESLFKALYPLVLRHFYFQDAELLEVDSSGRLRMQLLLDLHPEWPAGSQIEGQYAEFDGYMLSLISIPA